MSSEGKFWFRIWTMAAVFVLVLSAAGYGYNAHKNNLITKLILAGKDPILASCAIEGYGHGADSAICASAMIVNAK